MPPRHCCSVFQSRMATRFLQFIKITHSVHGVQQFHILAVLLALLPLGGRLCGNLDKKLGNLLFIGHSDATSVIKNDRGNGSANTCRVSKRMLLNIALETFFLQRILLWKSTGRYVEKPSRKNMRNKVPFAFDKYMTEWHLLKGCTKQRILCGQPARNGLTTSFLVSAKSLDSGKKRDIISIHIICFIVST